MDDPSPLSPEQSSTRAAPDHRWIASSDEYFPTAVPTSYRSSTAFTYGNWEEWMRWDGVAEPLSPRQLDTSPPTYRWNNKLISPPLQQERLSPGMMGSESSFPRTQESVNQVPMSAMDLSPFTFGYPDNSQADFRFGDAMNCTQDQPSPRDYPFRPDAVNWDAPPQLSPMTTGERQHLRNIAFQRTSSHGSQRSAGSAGDGTRAVSASPGAPRSNSVGKKRKSSGEEVVPEQAKTEPPVKKTAHNMIEKRYRTNLNDKISQLRDAVPSLRAMPKAAPSTMEGDEDREDLDGLVPTHKINKSVILSRACCYIQDLEKKNSRLEDENSSLRTRIRAFEKLAISGSIGTGVNAGGTSIRPRIQGPPFLDHGEHESGTHAAGPQGMTQVPEDIEQLRAGSNYRDPTGYHSYPHVPWGATEVTQDGAGQGRSNYICVLMVGSLEGLSEKEQDDDEPPGRPFFASRLELVNSVRTMSVAPHIPILGLKGITLIHGLSPLLKVALGLSFIVYLVILYLFKSKLNTGKARGWTCWDCWSLDTLGQCVYGCREWVEHCCKRKDPRGGPNGGLSRATCQEGVGGDS